MKLLNIYLYDLKNSGHYEFVHSVVEFAQQCEGISNHLAKWFAPFQAAVEEENRLMQISLKNVISEKLAKLDGERDGLVSSIHGAVNAMLKSIDTEIAETAQEVMNEITSLKVDIQDNDMNQTGQIDTLTAVLLGAQRSNVERLGLLFLVQRLHDVNQLMHNLMNQRDKEQFDRMNDSLAKARLVTDAAYAAFVTAFESYTFLYADQLAENDEGFTQFANDVNARIEYFRRYVLKVNSVPDFSVPSDGQEEETTPGETETPDAGTGGNGGSGSTGGNGNTGGNNTGGGSTGGDNTGGGNTGGDNTGGGNSGSTQRYTVTYRHNGAVYTTQEVEAGQRIQLPAAPEGYRWTNIPPQMPAQNITITSQEIGPDDF